MKNNTVKTGTMKLPEYKKEKKKRIFKFHKFSEIKKEENNNLDIMDVEKIRIFRMIIRERNRFEL